MGNPSQFIERRDSATMTINKTLLALSLGLALVACSNSQQGSAPVAEAGDTGGATQQQTDAAATSPGNNAAATQAAADTPAADTAAVPVTADAAADTVKDAGHAAVTEQAKDSAKKAVAPAPDKTNPAPKVSTSQTAVVAEGKALYQATCVACHGPKGNGAIPGVPDLTKGVILAKPDAELTSNIINGFQSKGSPMAMPPKGGNPNLTEKGAKAIVVYLRTLVTSPK